MEERAMFEWRSVLPGKRKDLFGKFPEQGRLRGVGEHQHHVDVTRTQLDQVAGVSDVRQLRHFYKVLPRRTAADGLSDKLNRLKEKLERKLLFAATTSGASTCNRHHRK